jgi:hypothetical protein
MERLYPLGGIPPAEELDDGDDTMFYTRDQADGYIQDLAGDIYFNGGQADISADMHNFIDWPRYCQWVLDSDYNSLNVVDSEGITLTYYYRDCE